jgi:hypothetical protein
MPQKARLRIHGYGSVELKYTTEYLVDLERAYESIFHFESLLEDARRIPRYLKPLHFFDLAVWPEHITRGGPPYSVRLNTPPSEQLVLERVQLNSPGFWEFLGALNPLEVIRQYLNDRHERRKDRDYRESAEERRLILENLKLENEVMSERIRLARDLGATNSDLALMMDQLIYQPLRALDRHQDRGVIDGAEITTVSEDKVSE